MYMNHLPGARSENSLHIPQSDTVVMSNGGKQCPIRAKSKCGDSGSVSLELVNNLLKSN